MEVGNSLNKQYDVLVVGGGPGGLFTAINSANNGAKVGILEKNSSAGRKLLLTGSGQCNLTHGGNTNEFLNHYGKNYRFLKPAFREFFNKELLNFFKNRGVDFIHTPEGRVLPSSLKAQDILDVLLEECKKKGIDIIYNEKVQKIRWGEDDFSLKTKTSDYSSEFLVIATGGQSYPATGSDGDGYRFAREFCHEIIETRPSLTPLYIRDHPLSDLSGISFVDIPAELWRGGRKVLAWSGDILLTHRGLSGPGILNNSRYVLPGDTIKLNFVRNQGRQDCRAHLDKILKAKGKMLVKNAMDDYLLPDRLVKTIINLAGISQEDRCAHLNREKRDKLANLLSAFPLLVEKLGDYNIAMVTRGGVNLREVNSKNMESRLIPKLFFVGEVLDIDGDTGGYNLQAVFSEAYVAGKYIAFYYLHP